MTKIRHMALVESDVGSNYSRKVWNWEHMHGYQLDMSEWTNFSVLGFLTSEQKMSIYEDHHSFRPEKRISNFLTSSRHLWVVLSPFERYSCLWYSKGVDLLQESSLEMPFLKSRGTQRPKLCLVPKSQRGWKMTAGDDSIFGQPTNCGTTAFFGKWDLGIGKIEWRTE